MSVFRRCRSVIVLSALSIPLPLAVCAQSSCPGGAPSVVSPVGTICGKASAVQIPNGGSYSASAYLGIPYAQPPIENLRWQNPQALSTLPQNPFQATQFGSECPQSTSGVFSCTLQEGQSEDCLYLNVWTPTTATSTSRLPVMVFIHGGAFVAGSGGSSPSSNPSPGSSAGDPYDGTVLANRGNVIVVTFNYRLGVLGFLAMEGITDTVNYNFGFRDQITALQWVQHNIGSFGGDAGNVTLFGESAGAMSVGLHALSSTQSAGLFNRGVMESNPLGLPYKTITEAADLGTSFATQGMECAGSSMVACMKGKTACELVRGANTWTAKHLLGSPAQDLLSFAPAIDDPQNPLPNALLQGQPLANAGNLKVPMTLGTNRDEGYIFVQGVVNDLKELGPLAPTSMELYNDITNDLFGNNAGQVRGSSAYSCNTDSCTTQMVQIMTDYVFTCANRFFASKASTANNTYIYQFQEVTVNPSCNAWGAKGLNCAGLNSFICHGNELPYVFDTAGNRQGCSFGSGPLSVSSAMQDYWLSFASGKAPTSAASGWPAPWPAFQTAGSQYLLISESPSTASDPFNTPANCSFWDTIGYQSPTAWARILASAASKNKK